MESKILQEYSAPLIDILDTFLHRYGQKVSPIEDSNSIWEKPMPPDYRPIRFTRKRLVHLGDVEAVLDSYIIDLYDCKYLIGFRQFWAPLFPRMRLYECVMQICRYAEARYLENNQFLSETFAQWRQLSASGSILRINHNKEKTQQKQQKQQLEQYFSLVIDTQILTEKIVKAKLCVEKLSGMFSQIAGLLRIPHITDGVPLRFNVSRLYAVLVDRAHVLRDLEHLLSALDEAVRDANQAIANNNSNLETAKTQSSRDKTIGNVSSTEGDRPIIN